MKGNWYLLISVAILFLVSSCKEDDPEPLKAETQAVLLAGSKGSTKSWKLSVATYQEESNPSVDFDLTPCILDNIYIFTNNDDQSYRATEGATRCNTTDPDLLEAGNWTFTLDGKILVVLPDELNYSDGALFSFLTYPSEILDLTETSMKLKMNVIELGSSYSYTLTFVKI
jgi:hypothetical protein